MIRCATAVIMTVVRLQVGAQIRPAQGSCQVQTAPSACRNCIGAALAARVPSLSTPAE